MVKHYMRDIELAAEDIQLSIRGNQVSMKKIKRGIRCVLGGVVVLLLLLIGKLIGFMMIPI